MAKAKGSNEASIEVLELETGRITVAVVGTTPLICNRQSEKTKRTLLLPAGKKTASEKQATMKHEPLVEYRNSPYTLRDDGSPTLLAALSVWFKKAMMTAALDTPGVKKTQMGRLVRAEGERIPLYGVPQLFMTDVRSADMSRTPDIRTRAIVPHWAVLLDITFAKPMLKEKPVLHLLARGGQFSGVGDGRTEKGWGNYGSFRLASSDDEELQDIIASGGRTAQLEAINSPTFYNDESEELFNWYVGEATERGFKVAV